MRFVTVRELSTKARQVWALVKDEEVVVTSNGKPIAILSGVNEESCERALKALRQTRCLVAIEELQRRSTARGLDRMSDEEIDAEVRAVRKGRRH